MNQIAETLEYLFRVVVDSLSRLSVPLVRYSYAGSAFVCLLAGGFGKNASWGLKLIPGLSAPMTTVSSAAATPESTATAAEPAAATAEPTAACAGARRCVPVSLSPSASPEATCKTVGRGAP